MTKHMHHRERLDEILRAASSIIEQRGVGALTMKELANETGLSRAWIYEFFPNVTTVLGMIWDQTRHDVMSKARPTRGGVVSVRAEALRLVDPWLEMSTAGAMIALYAMGNDIHHDAAVEPISDWVLNGLEQNWIQPMVDAGGDREDAVACAQTVHCAAMTLVLAYRRGQLCEDRTRLALCAMVEALIPAEWVLRRPE